MSANAHLRRNAGHARIWVQARAWLLAALIVLMPLMATLHAMGHLASEQAAQSQRLANMTADADGAAVDAVCATCHALAQLDGALPVAYASQLASFAPPQATFAVAVPAATRHVAVFTARAPPPVLS